MSLFPFNNQNFYHSKIDKDICKKTYEFIQQTKESYKEQSWNCKILTSLNVTNNILNCKEMHEIRLNIISHIECFMHHRNTFFEGYLYDSWINIYKKDFFQEFHTHESECEKFFSGVVYFTHENSNIEFNLIDKVSIKPEFSDIIIFDDHVPHRVCPNNIDSERISLAFNFKKSNLWKGLRI